MAEYIKITLKFSATYFSFYVIIT